MSSPSEDEVPGTYSTKELERPETSEEFEALCLDLYKTVWNDPGCSRVGRSGQAQFGLDILGTRDNRRVAVQCKKYQGKLPLSVIKADVAAADEAAVSLHHLLFATTAPSDARLVLDVAALSDARRAVGKFTVSVDSWSEIASSLYSVPNVGRVHIRNFPGSAPLALAEDVRKTFAAVQGIDQKVTELLAGGLVAAKSSIGIESIAADGLPGASVAGQEQDQNTARTLDLVRDKIRSARFEDAEQLLSVLGDPSKLRDEYSKFRFYTNRAAVCLSRGEQELAAELYLQAYAFAPQSEKAITNRSFAFLLLGLKEKALAECEEALKQFPESAELWATKIRVQIQLGDSIEIDQIPISIADHPSVAFAVAEWLSKCGDYQGAISRLKRQAIEVNGGLDAKRSLLAESLEWALEDKVGAFYGQIPKERREALEHAVEALGRIEDLLPSLQSKSIAHEIANNATVALWLLGKKAMAEKICDLSLAILGPIDSVLRLKITRLSERGKFSEVRSLVDGVDSASLSKETALIVAEIAANSGDVAWFDAALENASARNLEAPQRADLSVIAALARFESGDRLGAIRLLEKQIEQEDGHVAAICMLASLFLRSGESGKAEDLALNALGRLESKSGSEALVLADIFFDLGRYRDAASLYESLVHSLDAGRLSRRLLVSLVESDQRKQCWDLLETLPEALRATTQVRTIEINLCRRSGKLDRMERLLNEELAVSPDRADVALGLAYALYQQGDEDRLRDFLRGNRRFAKSDPTYEIELAKFQSHFGFEADARERLYLLLKANPTNSIVAGHYLSQMMLSGARLPGHDKAVAGTVVKLVSDSEDWQVAIGVDGGPYPWPEMADPNSPAATELLSCKVGDVVEVQRGIVRKSARVDAIASIYSFAAEKAHELLLKSPRAEGPISPVSVIKASGELDLELFLSIAKQKRERSEGALAAYRAGSLPVCVLASALGTDPVNVLLDWPFDECPLNIGVASVVEREASQALLAEPGRRYVTDVFTFAELYRRGILEVVTNEVGRLALPSSAKEHLLAMNQFHEKLGPSDSLSEVDGKLIWIDARPEQYADRGRFLRALYGLLDSSVDLCETLGPERLEPRFSEVLGLLDKSFGDSILLVLELDAVYLSEDAVMRSIGSLGGIRDSIGIQPILERAVHNRRISIPKYADVVAGKIAGGHEFVSISGPVLFELASRSLGRISEDSRAVLNSLRNKSLDLKSGIAVILEFLQLASQRLPAGVVAEHVLMCREVLIDGRADYAEAIDFVISEKLQSAYGRNGRRLNSEQRRRFGPLIRRRERPEGR